MPSGHCGTEWSLNLCLTIVIKCSLCQHFYDNAETQKRERELHGPIFQFVWYDIVKGPWFQFVCCNQTKCDTFHTMLVLKYKK